MLELSGKYKLRDLLIAKQIAELLFDRVVDSNVLKQLNKIIMVTKQMNPLNNNKQISK